MANQKEQIIHTSLDEQRRLFDGTSNIYDQLRIKALALIAGEVAIVTFLFTGWDFRDKLMDGDRIVFFYLGILLLGLAFGFLLWIISTVPWTMPHDYSNAKRWTEDKNYLNHQEFIEYLHDDYVAASTVNVKIVSNKCKKFNWSVFLLAGGVIIIMVIKFGGPQI